MRSSSTGSDLRERLQTSSDLGKHRLRPGVRRPTATYPARPSPEPVRSPARVPSDTTERSRFLLVSGGRESSAGTESIASTLLSPGLSSVRPL